MNYILFVAFCLAAAVAPTEIPCQVKRFNIVFNSLEGCQNHGELALEFAAKSAPRPIADSKIVCVGFRVFGRGA